MGEPSSRIPSHKQAGLDPEHNFLGFGVRCSFELPVIPQAPGHRDLSLSICIHLSIIPRIPIGQSCWRRAVWWGRTTKS